MLRKIHACFFMAFENKYYLFSVNLNEQYHWNSFSLMKLILNIVDKRESMKQLMNQNG